MPVTDWLPLCPASVDYQKVLDRDAYTKPIYDEIVSYRCRVSKKIVRVPNMRQPGTDTHATTVIWVLGLPDIADLDDLFSQDGVSLGIIVNWEKPQDALGELHCKVYLGSG
mgnify:CR=1 FL=1